MLKEERQQRILEVLRERGRVVASELSAALGTSEDTIRRDLREMSSAGLLQRVHGGALCRTTTPLAYSARQKQAVHEKEAVARACVGLLREGQVVILDGGTTASQVACQIPPQMRLTVVTNSPPIVTILAEHPGVDVIVLGGRLFKEPQVMLGAATVEAIAAIRADLCLLGVGSVHPEAGMTVLSYEEIPVKRAMLRAGARTVVMATADKLDKVAPYVVAPLSAADLLITERAAGEAVLAPYREHVEVLAV